MGKTRFKVMMVIGAALVALYFLTSNYIPGVDPALEASCRAEITRRGPDAAILLDRCREKAFASAMTARDASSAARNIGNTNQFEVLVHVASMFMLGLGSVLLIFGLLGVLGVVKPRERKS